jgi:cytochrome c553
MLAFRDNRRPGGDTIMAGVLYGVPDADVRAMAHYLAHLR